MNILAGFTDISIFQLALVAALALFASVLCGVSGYAQHSMLDLLL